MRNVILVAFAALALHASAELGTHRPCRGRVLLRVPLNSRQEVFRTRAPSRFTVRVSRFENGWAVGLFAPSDTREQENLLAPVEESGYYSVARWVLPESPPVLWLPHRILIPRSTPQELCVSVRGARTVTTPALRFVSGELSVHWRAKPAAE